ncbi:MAG TPA: alpha/beta hydrolase, partial [Dehalococcoidia bacterium]|nr:alpha/beta hydrolase [Dehalococcoidia bacterium]
MAEAPGKAETFVFKTVDGVHVSLDVYPASTARTPVLMSIHGGGLVAGSRRDIAGSDGTGLLRQLCTEAGFTHVSVDYRLAPETRLPGILEDIEDAWAWIHRDLPSLYDVDVDRSAVIGRSAGGLLALLSGIRLDPRPNAVVSLYGYGDLLAAWCHQPDPHYNRQAAVDEAAARRIADAGPATESTPEAPRFPLYLYLRQQGTWAREITGMDPSRDYARLAEVCPVRNIDGEFPPTLLLHGTADTDVPYYASVEMAHALSVRGLSGTLISIPDADHLFDRPVTRADLESRSPSAAAAALK